MFDIAAGIRDPQHTLQWAAPVFGPKSGLHETAMTEPDIIADKDAVPSFSERD